MLRYDGLAPQQRYAVLPALQHETGLSTNLGNFPYCRSRIAYSTISISSAPRAELLPPRTRSVRYQALLSTLVVTYDLI